MPQVSVVISTYNRRELLLSSLRSALGQRDVDLEVIVVDNGSSDGTSDLLGTVDDPRLRVLRNEVSLGSVGGRNTGIAAASGAWVGLHDDDDRWAPDKLRAQLDAAETTGRHWVYAGCVHIDGGDRILGGRPPLTPEGVMAELPVRLTVPGGMSNVMWRRNVLDGDGLLDPRLPFPADWDLALRLSRTGPPAVVSRPLVGYRQHGSNMSRHPSRYEAQLLLLERKGADLVGGRGISWGHFWRFVASEELRTGSRRAALRAYRLAVVAGDWGSVPRAAGVLLPPAAQRWAVRTLLSDADWLDEGRRWLREDPPTLAFKPGTQRSA